MAGGGGLGLSGGILAALPMPLGSESALGLAGPNGTPDIDELPAPAEPAGGVNCANAVAGAIRASAMMNVVAMGGGFLFYLRGAGRPSESLK